MVSGSVIYQIYNLDKPLRLSDFCVLIYKKGMAINTSHDCVED